jgi:hypothetical protein
MAILNRSVSKSYPDFFKKMIRPGTKATVEMHHCSLKTMRIKKDVQMEYMIL